MNDEQKTEKIRVVEYEFYLVYGDKEKNAFYQYGPYDSVDAVAEKYVENNCRGAVQRVPKGGGKIEVAEIQMEIHETQAIEIDAKNSDTEPSP